MDGYKEKTHMKIKCGAKVGSLESVENDDGDIHREFYIYNTGEINNSRYEEYTRRDKDNKTEVSMSKILKFPTGNFMGRTVQATMEYDPGLALVGKTQGSSTEVHFDSTPTPNVLKTVSYNISDNTLAAFEAAGHPGDFDLIRNSDDSSTILGSINAPGCKSAPATDPRAINLVSLPCQGVPSLSVADSENAFGIPLAISEIIRAKDSNHEFNINASGTRIFTIPAP
jgi:hypothetical protein